MTKHLPIITAALFLLESSAAWADTPYATEIIQYVQGTGVPVDSITLELFNNPSTAIGRPTIDTTGDDFNTGSAEDPVPLVGVNTAFRSFEVVSVGQGGVLVVKFDHAVLDDRRNPCGIDLIIYGNAFQRLTGGGFWTNGDPNASTVSGNLVHEPATVSVSQDGIVWFTFTGGPFADDFAPTLGRIYDPLNPDMSLGAWNQWWGAPTDATRPLNPAMTVNSFTGLTVAQMAVKYDTCAGGTGFDISQLSLPWIQYVKIANPSGSGQTPEVDAFADAAPMASPADFDCDLDVDTDDFEAFRLCKTGPAIGPPTANCKKADYDDDNDVDMDDFGLFQRCISGADQTANPNCMD